MRKTVLALVAAAGLCFAGVARADQNAIAIASPDGKRQVVAQGEAIAMVDAASGKTIFKATGHKGNVTALAFSPDGKTIASGGADNAVIVWDAGTGKQLWTSAGTGIVTLLTYSADGRQLIARDKDKVTRTYEAGTGKEIKVEK